MLPVLVIKSHLVMLEVCNGFHIGSNIKLIPCNSFPFSSWNFQLHGIVAGSAWHRRDSPVEVMRMQGVDMQWAVVPTAAPVRDLQTL